MVSGCAAPPCRFSDDVAARCHDCRANVHVIFVRSPVDAADVAGLANVAESFRLAGFCNTQLFHRLHDGGAETLASRVRRIRECQPGSRVMLVGFSSGALLARDAAKCLEADQHCIDSLVYVDSSVLNFVGCGEEPCNVHRHLLIYREGTPLPEVCGESTVCRIPEWNHLQIPTHPQTVDTLFCEAIRLADEASRCQSALPLPDPVNRPVEQPEARPDPAVPYESLPELPKPAPRTDLQAARRPESTQVILLPAPPRVEPARLTGRVEFDDSRISGLPVELN